MDNEMDVMDAAPVPCSLCGCLPGDAIPGYHVDGVCTECRLDGPDPETAISGALAFLRIIAERGCNVRLDGMLCSLAHYAEHHVSLLEELPRARTASELAARTEELLRN